MRTAVSRPNPSIWEVEVGEPGVQGQPGLTIAKFYPCIAKLFPISVPLLGILNYTFKKGLLAPLN